MKNIYSYLLCHRQTVQSPLESGKGDVKDEGFRNGTKIKILNLKKHDIIKTSKNAKEKPKMKYRKILLILAIATLSLTACKKEENPTPEATAVEETVTAITREQFMTLYENANSIYAVSPELFTEDADISIIDLPEISDTDIPISEAITLNEAIQILQEDNIPRELLEEIAESKGIISADTRWDEALTKTEAVELLVSVFMDEDSAEFNFKQGTYDTQEAQSGEFYYIESENAPDAAAQVEQQTEKVESTQQSSSVAFKSDLEARKKNLDYLLSEGIITQEEYDELWKEGQELAALADENGNVSTEAANNYYAEKNNSENSSSSGTEYKEVLPDYAVTKPSEDSIGASGSTFGQGDYSGLEHIRSN